MFFSKLFKDNKRVVAKRFKANVDSAWRNATQGMQDAIKKDFVDAGLCVVDMLENYIYADNFRIVDSEVTSKFTTESDLGVSGHIELEFALPIGEIADANKEDFEVIYELATQGDLPSELEAYMSKAKIHHKELESALNDLGKNIYFDFKDRDAETIENISGGTFPNFTPQIFIDGDDLDIAFKKARFEYFDRDNDCVVVSMVVKLEVSVAIPLRQVA